MITGVDEVVVKRVVVYPNPSTHQFIIKAAGAFSYQIFNQAGQRVETGAGENEGAVGGRFTAGIYVIQMQCVAGSSASVKVLKL